MDQICRWMLSDDDQLPVSFGFSKGRTTMQPLQLSHKGFKAYDIRGVVGAEVNEDLAYRVGRAYAALYHPQAMCVGYDIRRALLPSLRLSCEA